MSHFRKTVLSAAALSLVLALTACGGGGGGGSTPTSSGASTNPSATPAAPAASAVTDPVVTPKPTDPDTSVACTPGDAPQTRSAVFALINLTRLAMGLPQLSRLQAFDTTAQAHAQYAVANGSAAVEETSGLPCFTGADLAQRLSAVGIAATELPGQRQRSETIVTYEATSGEPQPWDYVNDTLNSVYGRMFLLSPRVQQIGLGASAQPGGARRAMVIDTALLPGAVSTSSNVWAVWPRDGATNLPTRMRGSNMKPLDAGVTEGYPISLHAAAAVQVNRFVLTSANDGATVAASILTGLNDRNRALAEGEVALLPLAPLAAGTTYRVEFDGIIGTLPLHQVWSFSTAP